MSTTRRDTITGLAGLAGLAGTAALPRSSPGQEPDRDVTTPKTALLVTEYQARGDGKTDDTEAFRKTFQAAENAGGAIVFVPPGRYRITGPLTLPPQVTLEGVSRAAPPRSPEGSVILADVPSGDENGQPFITLQQHGTLSGLCITYPRQDDPNHIRPFPWCVRSTGDNAAIVNCLLHNPYQAVDFGSVVGGRHFIDGLYAQPLRRGLYIDNCFDVGRVRNVHFWPFWELKARSYTEAQGTAFILGRTDWQFIDFCFCIWYQVGFHFVARNNGPGNVILTNSGSDIGPVAVRVDQVMAHAGISFVNGQFMNTIEVSEENTGPVKFTACGFWGNSEPHLKCTSHARLAGSGNVSFENCHFIAWDIANEGVPAIDARCRGLSVHNCDFMDAGKQQIRLGAGVESAIIMGNRLRGGTRLETPAEHKFVILGNSET